MCVRLCKFVFMCLYVCMRHCVSVCVRVLGCMFLCMSLCVSVWVCKSVFICAFSISLS